jgi:hypothetical protein
MVSAPLSESATGLPVLSLGLSIESINVVAFLSEFFIGQTNNLFFPDVNRNVHSFDCLVASPSDIWWIEVNVRLKYGLHCFTNIHNGVLPF